MGRRLGLIAHESSEFHAGSPLDCASGIGRPFGFPVMPRSSLTQIANHATDPDRRLYVSPLVWIGEFRCAAGHPRWHTENNAGERSVVVFPRTLVGIRQAGREPVLADPTCVMLYNPRQAYERELVDPRGDLCEWFAIQPTTVVEAAIEFDPWISDRADQPFTIPSGPVDPRHYLAQRRLYERVRNDPTIEPIEVEETFFHLLRAVLRGSLRNSAKRQPPGVRHATRAAHRDLADHTRRILGRDFTQPLTLDELASRVFASPYHLSRVFRSHVGMPIHRYLTQLRVRAALERLNDKRTDLTRLAFDLGFSSHSHFTSAFRSAFGVTPSEARASLAPLSSFKPARN